MPMRITDYRGEKTVKEIAQRVYSFEAEGPTPAAAGKRLIEANDHLPLNKRDLTEVIEPGTLIRVPEQKDLEAADSSSAGTVGVKALFERAAAGLDAMERAMAMDRDRLEEDLRETEMRIESDEFRSAARENRDLAGQLDKVRKRLEERRKKQDASDETRRLAISGAREELALLAGLAPDGGRQDKPG